MRKLSWPSSTACWIPTTAIKDIGDIGRRPYRLCAGEKFSGSVPITESSRRPHRVPHLAPLHNPPNIMGIYACQILMPDVPMVGVFDTAFHQTMPKKPIYTVFPTSFMKHKIRRFGFHGTSTGMLAQGLPNVEETVRPDISSRATERVFHSGHYTEEHRHDDGLTLWGLVMGTRVGDPDPGIVLVLREKLD